MQRFETPPGHQGQVDCADFRLPWGNRHALIVVLGYSRLMWLNYYGRQTMPVVMRGLEAALRYFGGVPWELLFDQMKGVIIADGRAEGGRQVENPEFLLPAMQSCTDMAAERCTLPGPGERAGRGLGPDWGSVFRSARYSCVSIQRRRRSDREREAGALATLSRAGDAEGGDRPALEDQQADRVQLDRSGGAGSWRGQQGGEVWTEAAASVEA